MFGKKRETYTAIKLYSVGSDQDSIDREKLVDTILGIFENIFNEYPEEYDISGPYKISKGSSVKIKTFKNKLEKYGHDKYYGYIGYTDNKLGFDVLFDANLNDSTTYTELIIWSLSSLLNGKFEKITSALMKPLSVSSGYQIEIEQGYDISSENKIKKGLFGGTSIEVTHKHLGWLKTLQTGSFRSLYKYNLWNKNQLNNALTKNMEIKYEPISHLYFVESNA